MISRRAIVAGGGVLAVATGTAQAAASTDLAPSGAGKLTALAERLSKAPRRRDFKSVPMILTSPDQWDHEALSEVLAYSGGPKQVWDPVDINSPWLNLMRNSLNAQIWSYKNPDFLCVSGTSRHGASRPLRPGHVGQISACQPGRRQIQDQHADRTAEACVCRSSELRGSGRRIFSGG